MGKGFLVCLSNGQSGRNEKISKGIYGVGVLGKENEFAICKD